MLHVQLSSPRELCVCRGTNWCAQAQGSFNSAADMSCLIFLLALSVQAI